MAHPDPSVVSHGLRALILIVVARQRAGIARMKVLPAPEPACRAIFIHHSFTIHSLFIHSEEEEECPCGGEAGPVSDSDDGLAAADNAELRE
jgi:hypothetical protein